MNPVYTTIERIPVSRHIMQSYIMTYYRLRKEGTFGRPGLPRWRPLFSVSAGLKTEHAHYKG